METSWCERELSEFINIKHGFAFKGEFFKDTPVYDVLVTPGNFAIGGGFKADKFKYYEGPIPNEYILDEGDLIVTMTDLSKEADTLGYSALVPNLKGSRFLHNQRVGLVEFKNTELDKTFLYFLLRSRDYRHHVISGATGTTVKHTAPKKIVSYRFDLPSKMEQKNIGSFLLSLEKKIELNRQMNETLEQMAQALFKSWFVDFDPVIDNALDVGNPIPDELAAKAEQRQQLRAAAASGEAKVPTLPDDIRGLFPNAFELTDEMGWIPKGWSDDELGSFIEFSNGKSKKHSESGCYPLYGANGVIGKSDEAREENSIIIGRVGAYCGAIEYCPDKYWPSDNTIVAKNRESAEMLPFVLYLLKYLNLNQYAGGAAQPLLNQTTLKKIKVPLATDDILMIYSQCVSSFMTKTSKVVTESLLLSNLRDALLPKLISGELQIPDAEQQVADALN